jgi:hypothetical protein
MFWVAPLLGSAIAAATYRGIERLSPERLASAERDEILIREREEERGRRTGDR